MVEKISSKDSLHSLNTKSHRACCCPICSAYKYSLSLCLDSVSGDDDGLLSSSLMCGRRKLMVWLGDRQVGNWKIFFGYLRKDYVKDFTDDTRVVIEWNVCCFADCP